MKKIVKVAGATIGVAALLGATTSALEATPTTIGDNVGSAQFITLTRNITDVTNPVSINYHYTIAADESNPASVVNLPRTADLNFEAVVPNEEHVATATYMLDLSGVSFSKVGDYKFTVKESSSTATSRYPLDRDVYYIYAYVRNELNEAGSPTGNLVATLAGQVLQNDEGDKMASAVFESAAVNTYIEVSNENVGDLADFGKYFKYQIDLSNASALERYVVSGQDAEVVYEGEALSTATELIGGSSENYIYLKHGQTVTIGGDNDLNQIPIGLEYTVSLTSAEGYTSLLDGSAELTTAAKTTLAVPGPNAKQSTRDKFAAANTTLGRNEKNAESAGGVLTGIVSGVTPFVIVVAIGGLCIFGYSKLSRKRDE